MFSNPNMALHYYWSDPVFDNISAFSSTLTHEECITDLPLNHYIKFLNQKDPAITKDLFYNFIQIVYSSTLTNSPNNLLPRGYQSHGSEFFALTPEQMTQFKPILDYYSNLPSHPWFDTETDPSGAQANDPTTFNNYRATHPINYGYTLNAQPDNGHYFNRVRNNLHGSLIEHKDENKNPALPNTERLVPNIPSSQDLPYTRYTSINPYWPHSHRNHNILKNDPYLIRGDMQDPNAARPVSTP